MVQFKDKSIWKSSAKTIINPCDCTGKMGVGFSRKLKNKYPEMFEEHRGKYCVGNFNFTKPHYFHGNPCVLNIAVQYKPDDKITLANLENLFYAVRLNHVEWGMVDAAFPLFEIRGRGISRNKITDMIKSFWKDLPLKIEIYPESN